MSERTGRFRLRPGGSSRVETDPPEVPEQPAVLAAGKGRPTPKRSESQRRRTGPVAPPPQSRREAARRLREQNADKRKQVREGTLAGDDRYFMPRDAGPVRKAVRDLVDSRRSAATLLLPAAVLPLAGQLSQNTRVLSLFTTLWLAALVLAVADFTTVAGRLRRMLRADFPQEQGRRGHVMYGVLRTLQFRRFRLPKPTVAPAPLRR